MVDERAEAALERAQEILERQPTPEELAQDEARRQRIQEAKPATHDLADLQIKWASGQNLTDGEFDAMRRLEAEESARQKVAPQIVQKEAPTMVRKVNENALKARPTNRPETEQEIIDRMKAHAVDLCCEIMRAVRAQSTTSNKIAEAITPIVSEIILVSIANQIKRAELERRIEALEKESKPRHRVKAASERTA